MLPVMFQNSWMPTVFEDFLNNDWMPRANTQNMQMIQGFVDGDEVVIKQVNQRAWQSAIVLFVLLLLIALMIWLLISFGSYLYSLLASVF